MHLEILVEEPSAEAALGHLVPKIAGPSVSFKVYPHEGKRDLLTKLPLRLRGYRRWITTDYRIIILIDRDNDDCHDLKNKLERFAGDANLPSKSSCTDRSYIVVNRLAIEELEAWFFGDLDAIRSAYPRIRINEYSAPYRHPDEIAGGTWETLERVFQRAGYFQTGMPKIEVARNISAFMDPQRNRSRSFQVFRDAILEISN
jgi:hypothetical protein